MKADTIIALLFVVAGVTLATAGAAALFGPVALLVAGVVCLIIGVATPWERL